MCAALETCRAFDRLPAVLLAFLSASNYACHFGVELQGGHVGLFPCLDATSSCSLVHARNRSRKKVKQDALKGQ